MVRLPIPRFLRRGPRVLLLDDDAAIQRLVTLVLTRAGYRVDVVSDGHQAIERLESREYDAVLLDLMMPVEGGVTVIRRLRESDPERLRKVVLLTGAPESLLQPYRSEVFGLVRKPFDQSELIATVAAATKQ